MPLGVCITLKALKPKEFLDDPLTFGEHVRKRRIETGLSQNALARKLNVNMNTVTGWENRGAIPPRHVMTRVLTWLNYDPIPCGDSVAERLKSKRRAMGWSQREAAKVIGVDTSVFARWELGGTVRFHAHKARVAKLLA